MREVGIVGVGHTKFGKMSEGTFMDMLCMAAVQALDDAGVRTVEGEHGIDQVFVATMGAGILNKQCGVASALVDLSLIHI